MNGHSSTNDKGTAGVSPVITRICLCASIVCSGLALRRYGFDLGLPAIVVKYGGSVLWGAMVFFLVAIAAPQSSRRNVVLISAVIAVCVEMFRARANALAGRISANACRYPAAWPYLFALGYPRLWRRNCARARARPSCRAGLHWTARPSFRKLKAPEAVQFLLDPAP
jgi:hypothetical protein